VSPRRGGEADKLGNRYEAAWTIKHLLFVLMGRGRSLRVEDIGDLAAGSEFTYRDAFSTQVHQLKRQDGHANRWTVGGLGSRGAWAAARHHVEAGREYHFVSTTSVAVLQDLALKSRQADDLNEFLTHWISGNKGLPPEFNELVNCDAMAGDAQKAFETLRGSSFSLYGETDINQFNEVLAETILEGASGKSMVASLASMLADSIGETITRDIAVAKLEAYELRLNSSGTTPELLEQLDGLTQSWFDTVERQLIRPVLVRPEATELCDLVLQSSQFTLVTGEAGGGKSAVLQQAVSKLRGDKVVTLAFRLDRLDAFSSTAELGLKLGLGRSPVAALAAAAGDAPSVLVVDQLDAVSFASGRMPDSLDAVVDLVREAAAFPAMRIVWVCRKFDVDNDERIRAISKQRTVKHFTIAHLNDDQVNGAVGAMGIDASLLRPEQRRLLQTPFNLSLLQAVADEADILGFDGTDRLFDKYWRRKRRDSLRRRPGLRFDQVVKTVAVAISDRQSLSIPDVLLDAENLADDADVLTSEHVLARDGQRIAFAHEAMFDYAFARAWITQGTSITQFLTSGEQELFRRGQLRQIMTFLRSTEPDRFTKEVEELLVSDQVRFHLKDVALAVLGAIREPSTDEAAAVLRAAASAQFNDRLWRRLSNPAWFHRFDLDGYIMRWLTTDSELRPVAIELVARGAAVYPERVAELVRAHELEANAVQYILRFADFGSSDQMFALLLDVLRQGRIAGSESWLWFQVRDLPKSFDRKAITLLQVFLEERPDSLALTSDGEVGQLGLREHSLCEFIHECSTADPLRFCQVVVPYLVRVIRLTRRDKDGFGYPTDRHFGRREREDATDRALDGALLVAAVGALQRIVEQDVQSVEQFIDLLASAEMDTAQYLLYRILIAQGERSAEWAADYVLGDPRRLFCGWRSNSVWTTRLLLQAISPHVSDLSFGRLEDMVRDLHFPWESEFRGYYAFTLLSSLSETRLSDLGKRRLGEYRRKFGMDDPRPPEGVTGGFIGPPIPQAAASKMRDENWLAAIRKHPADRANWDDLTGGARELSHVLRDETKKDPKRFANLALKFNESTHPSYGAAVLMGIGDGDALSEPEVALRAVRHLASLNKDEHDRWLGWALRPYMKSAPLDVVELIRDHALAATDPADGGLRFHSDRDQLDGNSDLEMTAINTVRGSLAEMLGDLLVYDIDGSRTAAVVPAIHQFASDPSVAVRVSVAHILAAMLRFDSAAALDALPVLLDADDVLLTASNCQKLLMYVGNRDSTLVLPIIDRMLASEQPSVRQVGGRMAAFAALEWDSADQLSLVEAGEDASARRGAAEVCAARLSQTGNLEIAKRVLESSVADPDEAVRKAAAEVVPQLRGQALAPFADTLKTIIGSPAYELALPQLLFTLQYAPDKIDELVVLTAQRFVEVHGADASDLRTSAAGEARTVGKLVIRALSQCRNAGERSILLDILDGLLLVGSYGVEELVLRSERGQSADDD
jgi:hypothetical protein